MKLSNLILLSVSILFLSAQMEKAHAMPAKRTPVVVEQSDGTKLTVIMYGDEFYHYATTTDGYTVVHDDAGYYCYAVQSGGSLRSSGVKANDPALRSAAEKSAIRSIPMGLQNNAAFGESMIKRQESAQRRAQRLEETQAVSLNSAAAPNEVETVKGLVILVNFKNVAMQNSASDMDNVLNQVGYSAGGAYGSVHDYFLDNSNGKFNVNFDVAGPYTLSQNRAYYGGNDYSGNDMRPREMVKEAFDMAAEDGSINLSDYATNGKIESLMIIYAGVGEADSYVAEAIWPHEWSLASPYTRNGVTISTYSCSNELRPGGQLTSIGVICHEYGHVLGLMDLYDTDGTTNGQSFGMDVFSLMDNGGYLKDGMRPPSLVAYERYMLGWLTPIEITEDGTYTLEPLYGDKAYAIKTSIDKEVFFFENRNGKSFKWDNFLQGGDAHTSTTGSGSGLFVTHIDRSSNTYAGMRSDQRWAYNMVNTNALHQCFRLVMAAPIARSTTSGTLNGIGKIFFPGDNNVTSFTENSMPAFKDWSGKSPAQITKIEMSGDNVILTIGEGEPGEAGLPSLGLNPIYSAGQEITLSVKNIKDIQSMVWKVNGTVISNTKQKLSTGEYKIEAEVTKTDGSKEYLMRYIQVK